MKAIIFFLLFLLLSFYAKSQEWAPSGATWHYSFNASLSTGFIQIKYIGDTITSGKLCKILEKKLYTFSYPGVYDSAVLGHEYTYMDNNIVYNYRFGKFFTLYDFNSKKGDYWTLAGWDDNIPLCDSTGEIKTDSVGTISIKGFNLNCLWVSPKDTSLSFGNHSMLVERIGSFSYMFPQPYCGIVDLPDYGPLRCYYDSTFGLYQIGSKDCDYITNIETNVLPQTLLMQVFPNPTNENITFTFNKVSKQDGALVITDIYGRTVTAISITIGQQSIQLNTKELLEGVYLYQFKSAGFPVQRGKFIVQ